VRLHFLIYLSLRFVFGTRSSHPLGDVEKLISAKNQALLFLGLATLTAIPWAFGQFGPIEGIGCWIKDIEPGRNSWSRTFLVPVAISNLFSLHLLYFVYSRRNLFVNDTRFLLLRFSLFVGAFVLQWVSYFVGTVF